jgi:predicted nucleic acid-binding Zn ribbon protein
VVTGIVGRSMPTYVYKFVDSGETIEVQQSFADDALTEASHPRTGEVLPVRKVFTPVGVSFKGGGFYKTDSRDSSSKAKRPSDGDASSSSSTPDKSSSSTSEKSSEKTSEKPSASPSSSSSSSSDS